MNKYIKGLINKIEKYNGQLKQFQDVCPHSEYDVISNDNDHDGWSRVEVTWYQTRRCKECDKVFSIETGKDRSHII